MKCKHCGKEIREGRFFWYHVEGKSAAFVYCDVKQGGIAKPEEE
jgi:hypothetical protein